MPPSRCCASTTRAVNAVACLPDGRVVTAGADGKIAIWTPGEAAAGHGARRPYRADRCARGVAGRQDCSPPRRGITPSGCGRCRGGAPRVLEGHTQNVNGVAFTPDGKARGERGLRRDAAHLAARRRRRRPSRTLPAPLNAVAVAPDGEIVAAGADGKVYFLSPRRRAARRDRGLADADHRARASRPTASSSRPPASAARSRSIEREARKLAAHAGRPRPAGVVGRVPARQSHAAHRRRRPHDPPLGRVDRRTGRLGRGRRAGGSARALTPAIPAREVFRACVACHTLSPDEGNRAGPTLARHLRAQDRDAAGLQFSAGAEEARHRVDAGDGREDCSRSAR